MSYDLVLVENLAHKKDVWSNDKRHFWKDWKYGHASLAVDGSDDILLPKCAIIDNYYAEHPIWMVDLGEKTHVSGVVILTWQGDGQGMNKQMNKTDELG
jgi:hypothetical protein